MMIIITKKNELINNLYIQQWNLINNDLYKLIKKSVLMINELHHNETLIIEV